MRSLDGSEYMPGLVGLNNMKANDYVNVVVQASAPSRLPLLQCLQHVAVACAWGLKRTRRTALLRGPFSEQVALRWMSLLNVTSK